MTGRVAQISRANASRISFSNVVEDVVLLDADNVRFNLSELLEAHDYEELSVGGRVIARFSGDYSLELTDANIASLHLVRLESRDVPLSISATVEWDIADCDETPISDASLADLGAVCGDGIVERSESCDDENDAEGDGCIECQIEEGGCSGSAMEAWSYWLCEGEPSQCEPQECEIGTDDPACDLLARLELDIVTNGLMPSGEMPGRVTSSPESVNCSCLETAITYECSPSCDAEVMPCTSLLHHDGEAISFRRWAGACSEDLPCSINVGSSRIIGVFGNPVSGVERESEFRAYPLENEGLDLRLLASSGGVVAAAGYITGAFEDPTAEPLGADVEPQPFIMALDEELEVVWNASLTVGEEEELAILDVAVDSMGDMVLLAGLFGTLALDQGTVTVDDSDRPGSTHRELALIKFSASGSHLWSQLISLPTSYHTIGAGLDVTDGGTVGLAAVIDTHYFGVDPIFDLVTSSVSPEGEVKWTQRLRLEDDQSYQVVINSFVSSSIDVEGSVFVAAGVVGGGEFQYQLPTPTTPGEEVRFLAKFDDEGALLFSEPLPSMDLDLIQIETDSDGRVVALTSAYLMSFEGDGDLRWIQEVNRRPYEDHQYPYEPAQMLDVEPVSGDIIVAHEASTLASDEDHLLAVVTSRFSSEGVHLWTVRRESWAAGEVFLYRAVSVLDDQVFVMGPRFLPLAAHNEAVVVRRMVN